jgi:2-amino-4-hydroxy-6-hydroxymethyldihydropteridine diphosphokinase
VKILKVTCDARYNFNRVAIIIFLIAMKEVYLLLGSNEGNRFDNLVKAVRQIELRVGKPTRQSSVYETEAWGLKEQASFLNQALAIQTSLSAPDLLVILKAIEKETGRTDTVRWGPREIDIDILFYGKEIVDLPDLKIPHPFLHERRFTLAPLKEIAPSFIHPCFDKTVSELLEYCADINEVTRWQGEDHSSNSFIS